MAAKKTTKKQRAPSRPAATIADILARPPSSPAEAVGRALIGLAPYADAGDALAQDAVSVVDAVVQMLLQKDSAALAKLKGPAMAYLRKDPVRAPSLDRAPAVRELVRLAREAATDPAGPVDTAARTRNAASALAAMVPLIGNARKQLGIDDQAWARGCDRLREVVEKIANIAVRSDEERVVKLVLMHFGLAEPDARNAINSALASAHSDRVGGRLPSARLQRSFWAQQRPVHYGKPAAWMQEGYSRGIPK